MTPSGAERSFAEAFADEPRVRHVTLAWDGPDAPLGSAQEFMPRGYELDSSIGLVATPAELRQHPRANQDVTVRALDPDADEDLWAQVIEVQVAGRVRTVMRMRRTANSLSISKRRSCSTSGGRSAWYVALDGDAVVGSCGVIVTDGRGRFRQSTRSRRIGGEASARGSSSTRRSTQRRITAPTAS